MALRLSHSRVDCFNRCPFKYQMRYVDRIGTIPNTDPDNALILGTALHTGIEEGVAQALEFYQNSFPILTDEHVNEMIKLEAVIPKAAAYRDHLKMVSFLAIIKSLRRQVTISKDLITKTSVRESRSASGARMA